MSLTERAKTWESLGTYGPATLLALLLGVASLYWTVVSMMVKDWWTDPNFSHGFVVPVFSGYLIWENRNNLHFSKGGASGAAGLSIVVMGIAMLILGKAGGEYFTMRASLVVLIAGVFLILFGGKGFRTCLFPLGFLLFMVPIPYILYDSAAFPLKMTASWIGEHSLSFAGVPVLRDGNIIVLPNIQLEVADACSGIRSLMTLMALAAATAHFMRHNLSKGTVLVVAAIPISVVTNSLRIFITGILSNRFGQRAAEGFFHEFSGWVVFLMGAFLVVTAGVIMRKKDDAGNGPKA